MNKIAWVLGSGSPRRKELLAGIGVVFDVRTKETPEVYPPDMAVELVPEFLASLKAAALLPDLSENEALICADTVVILNGEILGKPEDESDAEQMLQRLSGNMHTVITGVFIGNRQRQLTFSERTDVTFGKLTTEEIQSYIRNYRPLDKAGSYGVQEWFGYVAVDKLDGTYTNVMGLPTNMVYRKIQEFENFEF